MAHSLPGTPDIVLPHHQTIINVHGCFWHNHSCQHRRKPPKSNATYWHEKIAGNARRDARTARELRQLGWTVLIVWECQTRNREKLLATIERFLCIR